MNILLDRGSMKTTLSFSAKKNFFQILRIFSNQMVSCPLKIVVSLGHVMVLNNMYFTRHFIDLRLVVVIY